MRFVLVDRILRVEPSVRLVGEKTFDAGEELFQDHFPGRPLVPGTLLTEAIAQAGGWLLVVGSGFLAWPLLAMVERAKFRRPVRPGTRLVLDARIDSAGPLVAGASCRVSGEARIGDVVVAEARCVYRLFAPEAIGLRGEAHSRWMASEYRRLTEACGEAPPLPPAAE